MWAAAAVGGAAAVDPGTSRGARLAARRRVDRIAMASSQGPCPAEVVCIYLI